MSKSLFSGDLTVSERLQMLFGLIKKVANFVHFVDG